MLGQLCLWSGYVCSEVRGSHTVQEKGWGNWFASGKQSIIGEASGHSPETRVCVPHVPAARQGHPWPPVSIAVFTSEKGFLLSFSIRRVGRLKSHILHEDSYKMWKSGGSPGGVLEEGASSLLPAPPTDLTADTCVIVMRPFSDSPRLAERNTPSPDKHDFIIFE